MERRRGGDFKFEISDGFVDIPGKNQEKPDQGFRRTGAEVPLEGLGAGSRTAPPRPIFARASVNGRALCQMRAGCTVLGMTALRLVESLNGAIDGSSYIAGARQAAPLRPKGCDGDRMSTEPLHAGRVVNPRPYFDAAIDAAGLLKRLWRASSSNCTAALSASASSMQLQRKWPSSWA